MSSPSDLELRAARIVARALECDWRQGDFGGSQRADFDLLNATSTDIGVVEVTTAVHVGIARFNGAVRDRPWEFERLSHHWTVTVTEATRLTELRTQIEDALVEIEAMGLQGRLRTRPNQLLPEPLRALGVIDASTLRAIEGEELAIVFVKSHQLGGFYSFDAVTPVIQHELAKTDNVAKLTSSSGLGELFVWIDPALGPASATLSSSLIAPFHEVVPTLQPPQLPPGVSGVWAALVGPSPTEPALVLWRTTGERWEITPCPAFADNLDVHRHVWLHASPANIEPGQFARSPHSLQMTPRSFPGDLQRAVEMGHIRLDRVSIFDSEGVAVENHIGRFQFMQDRSTRIYEVEPVGNLELDPDPTALDTFRICERARVVRRLWPV